MPYSGITQFVGREDDLERLHQQLQPGSPVAISAVSGMGGIGKTELALQYADQHLNLQTYPGGICWLRAREELGTQIVSFAQSCLDLSPPEDRELAAKVAYCWQHWQEGAVLVVLDDVQDYQDIQSFLPPPGPRFRVLLTTRLTLRSPVRNIEIKVLTETAVLELLRSLVKDGRIDQQINEAKQICKWLGYLPLALELVGRYLARKPDTSVATLWQRLQNKRLDAKALKDRETGMTASLGVTAAFELSWEGLSEAAQQLTGLLSLFALAEIPWELVEPCLPNWDAEELEELRDEKLVDWHLLQRTGKGLYQLHQLLREFFTAKRERMSVDGELKHAFCRVMTAVAKQLPYSPSKLQIKQFTPVIPHLKATVTTLHTRLTDADVIKQSTGIANFYEGQAAYKDAIHWSEHSLKIAKTRMGRNHPDTATSLNNLARLYYLQGRYAEAEPIYLESLLIREKQLGTDHLDVAASLNNLAEIYESRGRYAEAEPLYQKALKLRKAQLDEHHPDIAQSLNNLAHLYTMQERYADAEPLYQKALELRKTQLGERHPDTAQSLNNLAHLYTMQGRYLKAEPLYQKALEILAEELVENHPDVVSILNNMGRLYANQERYYEAKQSYQKALEILEEHFCNHPNQANILNNIGLLYASQGLFSEAEPLYQRALEILIQELGENHPYVAKALSNLGELYFCWGESQQNYYQTMNYRSQARNYYSQAHKTAKKSLGSTHPITKTINDTLRVIEEYLG
ncbi:tetratricopeptide repeat protein [Stenomitos frigidus ULC18]|uniref:Tetratricopeptide repeat protein n=1 Tax=Stenomitos frigidus ULC18 TaxID=2107698 RepID=A0A2T1E3I3_9CYAN|nr:tetratricopeptide repeat protein [Stenomitos frigidus ULC18]